MDIKDVTLLLVQTGALGLCALTLMLGVWAIFQVLAKIDKLHSAIFKLACLVVDVRGTLPNDITPPEMKNPDVSGMHWPQQP